MENTPQIALGIQSAGSGFAGIDQVFGDHLHAKVLEFVLDAAIYNRRGKCYNKILKTLTNSMSKMGQIRNSG